MAELREGSWSLADWVILALIVEEPRHGFALVKELDPSTLLGQVWSAPNPIVYRSMRILQTRAMIVESATLPGARGPRRTLFRATPAGRRRLRTWLDTPVDHFRDVRMLLRLKVHLIIRIGQDPVQLLEKQRAHFAELGEAATRRLPDGEPSERELLRIWREESTAASNGFIERALKALQSASHVADDSRIRCRPS